MNAVFAQPVGCDVDFSTVRRPSPVPVATYALASAVGGAVSGAAAAAVGATVSEALPGPARVAAAVVVIVLAATALAFQIRGRMGPLPERKAQVPRRWTLWRSRTRTAAAFGLMIGSGVLTYVNHAAFYVLAVGVMLNGSIPLGAALGAVYGGTRGATVVSAWLARRPNVAPTQGQMRLWTGATRLLAPAGLVALLASALDLTIR